MIRLRAGWSLAILLVLSAAPAAADFQDGVDAYDRGDLKQALASWLEEARKGDPASTWLVGTMYLRGEGVMRPEPRIAAEYYRLAADRGFTEAQVSLATLYREGRGVPKDLKRAVAWLYQAAARRHPVAQADLGDLFLEGVPGQLDPDPEHAAEWYRQAADVGVLYAQFKLAQLYLEGIGVDQDDVTGFALLIRVYEAARRGEENDWSRRVLRLDAPAGFDGTPLADVIASRHATYQVALPGGVIAAARDLAAGTAP
ncbi:MAG: tetratricopeptide repeat protein [Alphaproteobacteria bacterium]